MAIKDKKPCKPGQVRNPETGRCKKVVVPKKTAAELKNNVIDPNKFFGKNAVQERNKARQKYEPKKKSSKSKLPSGQVTKFSVKKITTAGTADETAIGNCNFKEGIDSFCVRKVYDKTTFDEVIKVLEKHSSTINKYGPKILNVDKPNRSVFIEFISDSETIEDILTTKINPWEIDGFNTLKDLIKSVGEAIKVLHKAGFCHNDVNLGNFMFNTKNNKVRMIDFDTIGPVKGCGDINQVREAFSDALGDNILNRREKDNEKILAAQNDSIMMLLESADKNHYLF